MLGDIITVGKR